MTQSEAPKGGQRLPSMSSEENASTPPHACERCAPPSASITHRVDVGVYKPCRCRCLQTV
eukprot:1985809-Pyramimonas_sp.AAC.3